MTSEEQDLLALRRDTTLSTLVAGRIEAFILNGQLPAGERLNEVALARELGVSRGPVREAARLLASQGLIEFVANKGAFVREISRDELFDIYMLRSLLTGLACELAVERGRDMQPLEAIYERMRAAVATDDAAAYYRLNLEFHAQLVEISGSHRLKVMLDGLVKEQHLFRQVSLIRTPDMARSNQEHRAILDAMKRKDGAAARRLGEAHVRAGRDRFEAALRSFDT